MFSHVHATGAAYFAHAGNWVRLANQSEVFSGAFSALTGTPTTLTGYGITDAAPLASPALTGTPTAPTASSGTNTTQLATTAFVQSAILMRCKCFCIWSAPSVLHRIYGLMMML